MILSACAGKEDLNKDEENSATVEQEVDPVEQTGSPLEQWLNSIPPRTSYTNPVVHSGLPDPTVIRDQNGLFYLFATEDVRNIPVMVSPNLIDWYKIGTAFSAARRPRYIDNGELWAPEVKIIGGQYVLYYSLATTSVSQWEWAIGAATADSLTGKWIDNGKIINGSEIQVLSSIDPCFFAEGERNWLIWGSYYGIWAIELTEDGLSVKEGAEKTCLASGYGLEGAMLHKHDGYYYLFVSEGGTGYQQHYKLGALRSSNLLGPYVNQNGDDAAMDGIVDYFLSAGNGFISPGHCSEILTDDVGNDWVLYHAFIEGDPSARTLMLDRLIWVNGWPTIGDGHPTQTSEITPVFK